MLTLLLTSLLATPQQPPNQPATTELLPLRPLCGAESIEFQPPPVWGSLLSFVVRDERPLQLVGSDAESRRIDPDGVIEILQEIEQLAIDEGQLFLQQLGATALVFGEPAAVARTKQLIEAASNLLARPVRLELTVWDAAGRETPPAVLDRAAMQRLRATGSPLWQAVATGTSADLISIERMTWSRYVRSIEVEVATKMSMSGPSTDRYGEGVHAVTRVHSLMGEDSFAVMAQFALGQRRGVPRTVHTGHPGGTDIELPQLESYFGTFSGRVANGGALAVTMRGDAAAGGQIVLTLQVESEQPPASLERNDLALIPCGALIDGALTQRVFLPDPNDATYSPGADEQRSFGRFETDELLELARNVAAGDEDDANVYRGGGFLLVRGSAAAINRVQTLMRDLQQRTLLNTVVQHRGELLPQSSERDDPKARSPLTELRVPTLLGREAVAYRMLETNIVRDIAIEVASEAGTLEPRVIALQSGTWLRARTVPTAAGGHLDLTLRHSHAPVPAMRSAMPGGGVLMPASISTSLVEHDAAIEWNQAVQHGDGPPLTVEGRSYRSRLTTTIQRVR